MKEIYVYRIWDNFSSQWIKSKNGKSGWFNKSGALTTKKICQKERLELQYPPDRLEVRKFRLVEEI